MLTNAVLAVLFLSVGVLMIGVVAIKFRPKAQITDPAHPELLQAQFEALRHDLFRASQESVGVALKRLYDDLAGVREVDPGERWSMYKLMLELKDVLNKRDDPVLSTLIQRQKRLLEILNRHRTERLPDSQLEERAQAEANGIVIKDLQQRVAEARRKQS